MEHGPWLVFKRPDQISSTTDVNVTSFLFNLRKKKNSSKDVGTFPFSKIFLEGAVLNIGTQVYCLIHDRK